jgi:hypothetical protein
MRAASPILPGRRCPVRREGRCKNRAPNDEGRHPVYVHMYE